MNTPLEIPRWPLWPVGVWLSFSREGHQRAVFYFYFTQSVVYVESQHIRHYSGIIIKNMMVIMLNNWFYIPWNVLLFHFSIRLSFAHRPFTVRSACAIRAFIEHRFAFWAHRSLGSPFNKAFTFRSLCVHLPLRKRSTFIQRLVFIFFRITEDLDLGTKKIWIRLLSRECSKS